MSFEAPPWLVTFLQSFSFWDFLVWLAAIVALIVFIRKKGWRTIVALARGIIASAEVLVAVQELPNFIERTDRRLEEHTAQLSNSHSTNLRDDVTTSITTAQRAVETAERAVEVAEGIHGRLDVLEQTIDGLKATDDMLRSQIEHDQKEQS